MKPLLHAATTIRRLDTPVSHMIPPADRWFTNSVQHKHWPRCKWFWQKTKMGQAEQDPDLPCLAISVLGKVQSDLCLIKWLGQRKCRRGKSISGAACPAQKIVFCNLCCTLTKIGYHFGLQTQPITGELPSGPFHQVSTYVFPNRVSARISKMPVQNSTFKISACPDLATNLIQILIPATCNSLVCQKGQLILQLCPRRWFVRKILFITHPVSKLKNLHRKFCLSKQEVSRKLPVQRRGRTGTG